MHSNHPVNCGDSNSSNDEDIEFEEPTGGQATQARVILWAMPRSISTAFFRAIMEGVGIKVLLEPFSNAYYFGDERVSLRYLDRTPTLSCRFRDIVRIYEQPYRNYKSVFVKDMAYYLINEKNQHDFADLLPAGYTHTFLIRNPAQSIVSLWKLSIDKDQTGWDWFNPEEAGYKELYLLFSHVTEKLGQSAIVVDADDLVKRPRDTLIRYCSMTGLEFSEKMLSWKSISCESIADKSDDSSSSAGTAPVKISGIYNDDTSRGAATSTVKSIPPEIFRGWQPWFEGVLSSTSFCEYGSKKKRTAGNGNKGETVQELPEKVRACINECMPFYEALHKFKI